MIDINSRLGSIHEEIQPQLELLWAALVESASIQPIGNETLTTPKKKGRFQ